MIWRGVFGGDQRGLERVEQQLLGMLDADRHTFDLACATLLAGADPGVLQEEVHDSDRLVNQLVQQVRRELIVHAAVRGASTDVPALLMFMSVVKDIERVGDYGKELLGLSRAGADLSADDDHPELAGVRDRTSDLIGEVRQVLARQDAVHAASLLVGCGDVVSDLESRVARLVTSDRPADEAVPRALYYQYTKRIVAHLMNVLSSLVMPVDKLDFYDEPGGRGR
jgi:hypothetical protein